MEQFSLIIRNAAVDGTKMHERQAIGVAADATGARLWLLELDRNAELDGEWRTIRQVSARCRVEGTADDSGCECWYGDGAFGILDEAVPRTSITQWGSDKPFKKWDSA
jgi:hypothetical protein